MKVLIIGNPSSGYIYSFIKYSLEKVNPSEIFLVDYLINSNPMCNRYAEYYAEAGVRVFTGCGKENLWKHIGEIYKILEAYGTFDVCHIHSLNEGSILLGKIVGKFCKRMISNYWGSDWMRADESIRFRQEELLRISDYIVSDSKDICSQINKFFLGEFDQSVRFIRFKTPVIEEIRQGHVTEHEKRRFVEKYQIGCGKIILVCGYNGNPAHQHLAVFDALEQLPDTVKASIFIVIPATYGGTEQYICELNERLKNSGIQSLVIKDYLSELEVACLRSVTDIFINMQKTDAYSGTILEYTYLNKIVINGNWLNYSDLEKAGAFYKKVDKIEELTSVIERTVTFFKEEQGKFSDNTQAVDSFQTPFERNELWKDLYQNQGDCSAYMKQQRAAVSARNTVYLNELVKSYYMQKLLCMGDLAGKAKAWIEKTSFQSVTVYGAGHLGQVIYEQFRGSSLKSLSIADKFVRHVEWYQPEVIGIEEMKGVPPDVVIVTPVQYMAEIKAELAPQFNSNVITLDEWISAIAM